MSEGVGKILRNCLIIMFWVPKLSNYILGIIHVRIGPGYARVGQY